MKKKKSTKMKPLLAYGIAVILFVEFCLFVWLQLHEDAKADIKATQTVAVQSVSSQITAEGKVTAQDQATLHFQMGGKLTWLAVKEGDVVKQGQTIAQLDSYALQRTLTASMNAYKASRSTFDQSQQDQAHNVTQDTKATTLRAAGAQMGGYGDDARMTGYIDDFVKRLADQNQAALDNSVINVELANYAMQLATLTSPLNGIVLHEDVSVPYVNITPQTSFVVADPTTVVFRAMIPDYQIDYVSEGAKASVNLDGSTKSLKATVTRVYPSKVTLSSGQGAYQVDMTSTDPKAFSTLDQAGSVTITSNAQQHAMLIPTWTVLGGKYVWVNEDANPVLKAVTVGKQHGSSIEILGGLTAEDKVIIDPESIPEKEYSFL
jgi:multidrug efflux pump subunit AcrA (membrane-fusion protein)